MSDQTEAPWPDVLKIRDAKMQTVFALWRDVKYRKEVTNLVGLYAEKSLAVEIGRDMFRKDMSNAAEVFQDRIDGPFPLSGFNDDVSCKYRISEIQVNT